MVSYPIVSVVVPTYNRPRFLNECLTSLFQQSYPPDRFEVIVVDDGSDSYEVKAALLPFFQDDVALKLVSLPRNLGPGAARQEGLEQSQGELVAFVDDDATYHPNWLESLVRNISDYAGVGGRLEVREDFSFFEKLLLKCLVNGRAITLNGVVLGIAGNSALFKKRVLLEVKGFMVQPYNFCEDLELNLRLRRAGYSLGLVKEAISYHHSKSSLREFIRKRMSVGFEHTRMLEIYRELYPSDWKSLIKSYHLNPRSILTPPYSFFRAASDITFLIPSWLGLFLILLLHKIGVNSDVLLRDHYLELASWCLHHINRQVCDSMVLYTRIRQVLGFEKRVIPVYGFK